jgi:putative transposase
MLLLRSLGLSKGRARYIARTFGGRKRNFTGQHFWARGYWVSTVGRDEEATRKYIQQQEGEDRRLDQDLGLPKQEDLFHR